MCTPQSAWCAQAAWPWRGRPVGGGRMRRRSARSALQYNTLRRGATRLDALFGARRGAAGLAGVVAGRNAHRASCCRLCVQDSPRPPGPRQPGGRRGASCRPDHARIFQPPPRTLASSKHRRPPARDPPPGRQAGLGLGASGGAPNWCCALQLVTQQRRLTPRHTEGQERTQAPSCISLRT